MELKDYLTNEVIKKRFENQFDLVNYAIKVAEEMIHAGRGPRVKTETENPALQVLEEIVAGKDKFEEGEAKEREQQKSRKTEAPSVVKAESSSESQNDSDEEESETEKILTE